MPFDITLEKGERLIANLSFMASRNSAPFHIAVSNRAIFLPRKKLFAVKDPTYCERVSLNRVVEGRVKKLDPYVLWSLALLMVAGGTATTGLMLLPILRGEGGQFSGYPPAVALVGLVIPFIATRRFGLSISMTDETFLWKPPLLVDRASRGTLQHFLAQVADAFRRAGVEVKDERESSLPVSRPESNADAYPVAKAYGESSQIKGVLRACYHCGKPLKISRWDDWNGFLFRCPYCERVHGKPWRAYPTLLASVLLNGISFFFTMRWKHALPWFVGFALLFVSISFVLDRGQLPETLSLALLGVAFMGPLAVNSVLLLRHEMALKAASVVRT